MNEHSSIRTSKPGIHDRLGVSRVINAAGTFTPVGVSRSSAGVAEATSLALGEYFVIDELQTLASRRIAALTGAEAGCVTHCVAAAICLGVSAAMAGIDTARIAALPDTEGRPNRVVLPAGHAVDYGHAIEQDVRLAGALPLLAGDRFRCTLAALEAALADEMSACLLLVSSRLVKGENPSLEQSVAAAHRRGVPAIIDGAAQDLRIGELLATGADLVLVSGHKYLASPTAGLVIGSRQMVAAVRAQERGIGRAMKASKEAIVGVLAAIDERERLDIGAWRAEQARKADAFVQQVRALIGLEARGIDTSVTVTSGIEASLVADPAGMPFARVRLTVDPRRAHLDAASLAAALREGEPAIWTMEHECKAGRINFELVGLDDAEMTLIVQRIAALLEVRHAASRAS